MNPQNNLDEAQHAHGYRVDPNLSFEARGKVPQIAQDLPDFNGEPRGLAQWIVDVEDILELYQDKQNDVQYYLLLKTIRRKIKN